VGSVGFGSTVWIQFEICSIRKNELILTLAPFIRETETTSVMRCIVLHIGTYGTMRPTVTDKLPFPSFMNLWVFPSHTIKITKYVRYTLVQYRYLSILSFYRQTRNTRNIEYSQNKKIGNICLPESISPGGGVPVSVHF
jgi:hypothetical protein